jgi:hypothetical protein
VLQIHMLRGLGPRFFEGRDECAQSFHYSLPNLLLLDIRLPLPHSIEQRWAPVSTAMAVSVAADVSVSVPMGRVLLVLDLKLNRTLVLWVGSFAERPCATGIVGRPSLRSRTGDLIDAGLP